MCNHKFVNDENKSCNWDEFLSRMRLKETGIIDIMLDLPHDAKGECIFHSQDLEWKRENNFTDWLKNLFFLLDNYDNETEVITLDDVIFIGNSLLNEQDSKYKVRTDAKNELYCYMFENTFCNKSIVLNNAKFEDIIILKRCCLKNDLVLQNCSFSKGISISQLTIGGDLHIYNSYFQKKILIASDNDRTNIIYGGWYIEDSTFEGDSYFNDLIITNNCTITNNKFKHKINEISFNCQFSLGLEFFGNSATNLTFSSCGFYYNCIFDELKLLGTFSMFHPKIGGQLKFIGNETDLLFNPKTIIEIDSECFEEDGMITFDCCNLLDLGVIFIENCRKLEEIEKIRILPSCKVDRLKMVYEYSYTELKSNLIEDFANIVCRYFRSCQHINLSVNIIRVTENNSIMVVFKTTDDITPERFNYLLKKFPATIYDVKNKEPEVKDIQRALYDIIQRVVLNDALEEFEKEKIITLNGGITIIGKMIQNSGTIGMLNVGGVIKDVDKIEVTVNQLQQSGANDMATSICKIKDAILQSQELDDKIKEEVLEQLTEISEQANLPEENRSKKSVLRVIFNGIDKTLSTVANLAKIWETWGANISTFFNL